MFDTRILTTKLSNHAHIKSDEVSYGITFSTCMNTGRCVIVANITIPDYTKAEGVRVFQEMIRR